MRIFEFSLLRSSASRMCRHGPGNFHFPGRIDRGRFKNRSRGMQMMTELEVYQAGELTVLGFGGRETLDRLSLGECRQELMRLIHEHHCQSLAIDLTGVRFLPSGLLGLLC